MWKVKEWRNQENTYVCGGEIWEKRKKIVEGVKLYTYYGWENKVYGKKIK